MLFRRLQEVENNIHKVWNILDRIFALKLIPKFQNINRISQVIKNLHVKERVLQIISERNHQESQSKKYYHLNCVLHILNASRQTAKSSTTFMKI